MRLFVAAWPPAEVVGQVAALPRPDTPWLRWTAPAQWHVTLRFFGEVREPEVDGVVAAFGAVPVPAEPVVAEAGPAVGRFGNRVLHIPVRGLEDLAAAVAAATAGVGRPPEGRPEGRAFAGHLTLARSRGGGDLRRFALTGHPFSARWPVEEVTLVHSVPGRAGSRYEVIARVPL